MSRWQNPDALLASLYGWGSAHEQQDDGGLPSDEEGEGEELECMPAEHSQAEESQQELLEDVDIEVAIARIEAVVLEFLGKLSSRCLPDFFVVSRGAGNAAVEAGGEEGELGMRLQQRQSLRSLAAKGRPESMDQFSRLFKVLELCHEQLLTGAQMTQRELYYRLKALAGSGPSWSLQQVNEAVQDAVSLLRLPRSSLGITCSSKGLVAGRLHIRIAPPEGCFEEEEILDCTTGIRQIDGNIQAIGQYEYQSDAQAILVVEKDAIFQRLVEDKFFDVVPCILLTGKGFPDVASRAFLHSLHEAFPRMPIVGLADWNPSGVAILRLYKWGSRRMEEASRFAVPTLQWLGMRSAMLLEAEGDVFQELTARDASMGAGMLPSLRAVEHEWAQELEHMLESRRKAEIEAVYNVCGGVAGFSNLLVSCMTGGGSSTDGSDNSGGEVPGNLCCSKGLVAGRLVIHNRRTGDEVDCSQSGSSAPRVVGHQVTAELLGHCAFQSDAVVLLVIQEYAIFQRLVDSEFFASVPSILLCAKGSPDQSSMAFLHSLTAAFPQLPVAALADWSPAGVAALSMYKWGPDPQDDSSELAAPSLQWLALRSAMLTNADWGDFQELSPEDADWATEMEAALGQLEPEWAQELGQMLASGSKAALLHMYEECGPAGFLEVLLHQMRAEGFM